MNWFTKQYQHPYGLGAVRVEMQKESPKDRLVHCIYEAPEPGEYTVFVSWSGQQVPGSPFPVRLFGSLEELEHFNATQSAGGADMPYGPSVSVSGGLDANGYN